MTGDRAAWDVNGKAAITSPGNLTTTAYQLAQFPPAADTADNASLYKVIAAWAARSLRQLEFRYGGWLENRHADRPRGHPAYTYKTTISLTGTVNSTASVTATCLDDTGNSSANGNKVQIWACNGGAAQNWTYAEDGTLRIHGKCLDDTGYGTKAGPPQLWSCLGHANQTWTRQHAAALAKPGVWALPPTALGTAPS